MPYPEAENVFSQALIHQHKLYHKVKVGCKGLTGIQQTVALWKGIDSRKDRLRFGTWMHLNICGSVHHA